MTDKGTKFFNFRTDLQQVKKGRKSRYEELREHRARDVGAEMI